MCRVRPDPWHLQTHMEKFSRMQKAIESQRRYLAFLLCFGFEKRRGLLQDCLLENYSNSLGAPVEKSLQESM